MFGHPPRPAVFHSFAAAALAAVAVGTFVACADTDSPAPTEVAIAESELTADFARSPNAPTNPQDIKKGLARIRRATARFHRIEVAKAAGYVPFGGGVCLDFGDPGAAGIPYAQEPGLVFNDDGTLANLDTEIDLTEPEALFYEEQKNGELRLVAIELLVDRPEWDATHDQRPTALGQEFHTNPLGAPVYGFHAWVWRHNPAGMFAIENPRVTCEFFDGPVLPPSE